MDFQSHRLTPPPSNTVDQLTKEAALTSTSCHTVLAQDLISHPANIIKSNWTSHYMQQFAACYKSIQPSPPSRPYFLSQSLPASSSQPSADFVLNILSYSLIPFCSLSLASLHSPFHSNVEISEHILFYCLHFLLHSLFLQKQLITGRRPSLLLLPSNSPGVKSLTYYPNIPISSPQPIHLHNSRTLRCITG